ncbi:PREDICTED: G-type lectin S-receptor [Prunus dulcis]|uniref:Receptor-like serine/threonine-protein kinase n=1 Tax=Prunus dulcis TaxID=3755 RepID=A0A5E4G4Y0_PRUDU|nr:PREDICTED: G-type lectin S-receptor [Prunus dulcis]
MSAILRVCQMMGIASKNPGFKFHLFSFLFTFSSLALFCSAASSITQGQSLRDGETLISDGEKFELGFFSPENSSSRYVGIWYYNISTSDPSVIWVANRERPIFYKTGILKIGSDGNVVVLDGNNTAVWSSNASASSHSTAILNDEGNLVLSSSGDTSKEYWQSFGDPTNTFLPGMKVEVNSAIGENRFLTSWKSENDPSPGAYSMGVDPRGSPQIVIWEGSNRRWRSGHWNKQLFIGVPNMPTTYSYGFKLSDENGNGSMYFTYTPWNVSDKLRFQIRWDGYEEQLRWVGDKNQWEVIQSQPNKSNDCELYNRCGKFGVCSASHGSGSECSCMHGFQPTDWDQWIRRNWSDGCSRKTLLQCHRNRTIGTEENDEEDGFVGLRCAKLPDFADLVVRGSDENCEEICLKNCSCTAYAFVQGIGCMIWTEDLLDVQKFTKGGNTLNIRLAHSDLGGKKKLSTLVIIVISVAGALFLVIFMLLLWRFKAKLKVLPTTSSISWLRNKDPPMLDASKSNEFSTDVSGSIDLFAEGNQVNGSELPLFNFACVAAATNNFSEENKLGKGGFGTVYKGNLPGLQEVAIKRLSRRSGQGLEEFKNEISLIAKLQHRNLVRLLGCCIQGEEKMLLYEYMPNKSLDFFLFDPSKQALLDWRRRFAIIEGIARGLLYLHRDSRLRIIHRDLKASNILLDADMIPKISDFGMARIFGGNQNEANTNRVVGTYGYMSPEYAMGGIFSEKSDVYSFGVLILEIISGRKNTSFYYCEQHLGFLGYAWKQWKEGKGLEIVDSSLGNSYCPSEVLRCIQVGLLCVQEHVVDRPTMSSVVFMLSSPDATMPQPKTPGFCLGRSPAGQTDSSSSKLEGSRTIDQVTIAALDGR